MASLAHWLRTHSPHRNSRVGPAPPSARRQLHSGQALTEYALGIVLVSLVTIGSLALVGPGLQESYCEVIDKLQPGISETCSALLAGESGEGDGEEEGQGPVVLNANYNEPQDRLTVHAQRPEGCSGDLIVQGYGTMSQQGQSDNFSIVISTADPPATVTVGSEACGWTTAEVN